MTRRSLFGAIAPLAFIDAPPLLTTPGQSFERSPGFFSPLHYGARADGKTLDTAALNAAIAACSASGGGIVYVSPGVYRCGTVVLQSNVTLYLEAGATLCGSTEIGDYTAMAGGASTHGDTGTRHLIFARGAENLGIAGPGCIDGQGESFWKPSGIPPLPPEDAWADVIARGTAEKGERPSPTIEFVDCKRIRVEDVRIQNAPSWTMRPVNCDDVHIRAISIRNPVYGHNTDGLDITGCTNVFTSDCSIETGDDAICLKSQNPYGGEPKITRNIVITNCILTTCSNGFKLGTATEGGFENITFSNSVIYNNDVAYKERVVAGIALEIVDGGWIDGIVISGIRMQRTRTPLFIRWGNRTRPFHHEQQGIRGISIDNVHAEDAVLASSITGLPGAKVKDISLSNMTIENSFPCRPEWVGREVPERPDAYPEARMFGMLPCSGLYVRHVDDIRLNHLSFRATQGEARPTIICNDVSNATISGVRSTPIAGTEAMIQLVDAQNVWISGCSLPDKTQSFVSVDGERTEGILLSGNNLQNAKDAIHVAPRLPKTAVVTQGDVGVCDSH